MSKTSFLMCWEPMRKIHISANINKQQRAQNNIDKYIPKSLKQYINFADRLLALPLSHRVPLRSRHGSGLQNR